VLTLSTKVGFAVARGERAIATHRERLNRRYHSGAGLCPAALTGISYLAASPIEYAGGSSVSFISPSYAVRNAPPEYAPTESLDRLCSVGGVDG
jgi:hypothetical protein